MAINFYENIANNNNNNNKMFGKNDYINLVSTLSENTISIATRETRTYVQEEREQEEQKIRM